MRYKFKKATNFLQPVKSFAVLNINASWIDHSDIHKVESLCLILEHANKPRNGILRNPRNLFSIVDSVHNDNEMQHEEGLFTKRVSGTM